MDKRQAKRVSRELTSAEKERLAKYREQIAQELPDLAARDQMRKDAREESTLSGEFAAPFTAVACRWPRSPRRRALRRWYWTTSSPGNALCGAT